MCTYVDQVSAEAIGIGFNGTEITDGCDLPWGHWELNLGSLIAANALTH